METTSAVVDARDCDRQFTTAQRGSCRREIEGAVQRHGSGELAELALNKVKRVALGTRCRSFFADDEQDSVPEGDPDVGGWDAWQVDDDLHLFFRLNHVCGRLAFTGECTWAVAECGCQLSKEATDIVVNVRKVVLGEGDLGHGAARTRARMFSQRNGSCLRRT